MLRPLSRSWRRIRKRHLHIAKRPPSRPGMARISTTIRTTMSAAAPAPPAASAPPWPARRRSPPRRRPCPHAWPKRPPAASKRSTWPCPNDLPASRSPDSQAAAPCCAASTHFTERGIMYSLSCSTTRAHWRVVAGLLAALATAPGSAQTTASDPDAPVPQTRYQPAHVGRAPVAPTTTPDRTWQENNRIVAGQPGHAAHAGHGAHAGHAGHGAPAAPAPAPAPAAPTPAADPHAHHHDHHAPPDKKEHH